MNITSILRLRWVRLAALVGVVLSLVSPLMAPSGTAQDDSWKTPVYPGAVVVEAGTCIDQFLTPATVSVPSDTLDDGIVYTITQPDATGAFTVTAQVGDDYLMAEDLGGGWVWKNKWNATYSGTAPEPICDGELVGPTATADTDDATTDEDAAVDTDVSVFALPLDCGSIPYPAPTGDDVSDSIVFSNYVLTQNGTPYTSGTIDLTSPDEVLTLGFDWTSTASLASGQYFTFAGPVDSTGAKVFTSATQWFPVMNAAGTAQAGCASVVGGDVTVQFTNYVNGRSDVGGRIDLYVEMHASSAEETTSIEFSFDDDSTFVITIPGTPPEEFGKRGWFMRDDQGIVDNLGAVRWQLHVPANPLGYTNLVLTDVAPEDGSWTFSCGGPSPTTTVYTASGPMGPVTIDFTEDCTATSMTLAVANVPANTDIDFYFYADITPLAEGPFYNEATASADNIVTIQLPYEVRRTIGSGQADGSFAVIPVPPAVDNAVCVDDVWIPATVTLPTDQEGVTYTMTPDPMPAEGGHLVVIATLAEDYVWAAGADANGWVLDETNNTMVFETDVTNTPCVATPTPPVETPTPPVETPTPPVETPPATITPTPENPCVPPTPEECVPTPTPPGTGTPPSGETPTPCVPGQTPTPPAWCSTPTPPPVTEFPKTGADASGNHTFTIVAIASLAVVVGAAASVVIHRERVR